LKVFHELYNYIYGFYQVCKITGENNKKKPLTRPRRISKSFFPNIIQKKKKYQRKSIYMAILKNSVADVTNILWIILTCHADIIRGMVLTANYHEGHTFIIQSIFLWTD
jgi:ribosomal protein S6